MSRPISTRNGKVSGSVRIATFESERGQFDALPQVLKIGRTFYQRVSPKDLTAEQVAYAEGLSVE